MYIVYYYLYGLNYGLTRLFALLENNVEARLVLIL